MIVADEPTIHRRVFEAWSIRVPGSFEETFVLEGSYWHAWDATRSVSLTSSVVAERGRPVAADAILAELQRPGLRPKGKPVHELPPGLDGWAVEIAVRDGRASRALTGMLAAPGRVLIATITADDQEWARETWCSIGAHLAPLPSRAERRHARRGHGNR